MQLLSETAKAMTECSASECSKSHAGKRARCEEGRGYERFALVLQSFASCLSSVSAIGGDILNLWLVKCHETNYRLPAHKIEKPLIA